LERPFYVVTVLALWRELSNQREENLRHNASLMRLAGLTMLPNLATSPKKKSRSVDLLKDFATVTINVEALSNIQLSVDDP